MPTTLTWKQKICESLEVGTLDVPSHVAFGSGTATFSETDTELDSELVRNAISNIDRQSTTIEWTATLTEAQANGSTINEVGLFNDATTGDMAIRQIIYPVNKTSSFEYDAIFVMRIK